MKPRFFGQYLLERGVIGREALLDALRHQQNTNIPLGLVALEKRMLTSQDFTKAQLEAFSTGRSFWEVALAHRMLTKPQIVELLGRQVQAWQLLGDVLVQRGHVRREIMDALTEEFQREQEAGHSQIEEVLASLPHPTVVRAFHDVTTELFLRMVNLPVKTAALSLRPAAQPLCDVPFLAAQPVVGERKLSYALALPDALSLRVASQLLRNEQTAMTPVVQDAVCEFVNMIVGNGCIRLGQDGVKVTPQPPRVFRRGDALPAAGRSVLAEMTSPQGEFQIRYYLQPA